MRALNLRRVERAVTGGEPGPEGNITKLLTAEHSQRSAELGLALLGPEGAVLEGDGTSRRLDHAVHACTDDRRRHVGDHAQPDRRAHPRAPARSVAQLTERGPRVTASSVDRAVRLEGDQRVPVEAELEERVVGVLAELGARLS